MDESAGSSRRRSRGRAPRRRPAGPGRGASRHWTAHAPVLRDQAAQLGGQLRARVHPSLRYPAARCVSTVLIDRNSSWAITRLPFPTAASSQIWRWRGVSAAVPSIAAWRGRRPVATSSAAPARTTASRRTHRRRPAPAGARRAPPPGDRRRPAPRPAPAAAAPPRARAGSRARPRSQSAIRRVGVGLRDRPRVQRVASAPGRQALRRREGRVGQRAASSRRPRCARARAAVERQGFRARGSGRPCSARSAPASIASAWARSKSPSASHRRARAWRRPISQHRDPQGTVQPPLAQQLAGLAEHAALGQGADPGSRRAPRR